MNKNKIAVSLMLFLGVPAAQAAMLSSGNILTINAGVQVYDSNSNNLGVSSGSYFGVDASNNLKVENWEKWVFAPVAGAVLQIGIPPLAGQLDDSLFYNAIPFEHYSTVGVTGGTSAGLDFSGWSVLEWSAVTASLGAGAWTPTNCATAGMACSGYADGVAVFNWSGVYGDSYTLDYTARFPSTDSNFGYSRYFLHLEGTVEAPMIPVPAAAWLFGSGLLGLMGVIRRKTV